MGRQNNSTEFRIDVAGKFWQYMKDAETMPETTDALRKLYLNVYRPLLDLPPGQRVKFGSVLSCMKEAGLLSTSGESQETIVYRAEVVELNWSCSEGGGHTGIFEAEDETLASKNEELPTTKLKRRRKRRGRKGKKESNNVSLDLAELREMLDTKRSRLIQDKGNVEIYPKSNKDGVIDLGAMNINEVKSLELDIGNFNNKKMLFGYVVLESAKDCNVDTTSYEVTVESVGDALDALGHVYVPVEISANNPGIFHVPLLFWFKCGNGKAFHIVKFIKAEVISNPESELLPAVERRQENDSNQLPVADLRKEILSQRQHLAKDKENVTILPASNKDGVIDMGAIDVNEPKNFQLHIRNLSERKLLFGYVVLGSASDFRVDVSNLEVMGEKEGRELGSFECVPVALDISVINPGIFQVVLAFWFKFGEGTPFQIIKFIKAEVTDNLVKELQPISPYVRPKPSSRISKRKSKLIPGEPPSQKTMQFSRKLNSYEIPGALKNHAKNRTLVDHLTKLFDGHLTAQNHRNRFSNILHVEEMEMENDIQRYNMEKAKLRKVSKQYLALAVPGLAENRPSLVRGDRLFVRKLKPNGTEEDDEYEGFVHRVELEEVHLRFCSKFHERFVTNMSFSVRFTFSRTPLKLMHRAIGMPSGFLSQLASVGDPQICVKREVKRLRLYDPNIANNDEQKQAVENIVFGTSRPYPYLVFGPPGTGKTVTMVESIKQVLKNDPKATVLACTPSNSAADLILQRVSQHNPVPQAQMVRLNAYGRAVSSVDPKLMKFCPKSSDGCFCFPSKEEIMLKKYRLVITTLTSAGRLVSMGFGNSHFTHIFIDEAGHGMEPECLIPIAGLYKADRKGGGQLVLAGDPKQLGPVLRSPEAVQFGLGKSLLERLMGPQFPCFNRLPSNEPDEVGRYDEKFVTKLLNNYRSHPAIIKLPNDMFYANELRACANQHLRESWCQWNGLRKKRFPVVFEGVCGKDQREGTSPSFFNPQEVSVVLRYVKDVKEAMGVSVKIEDNQIGIISPYHRQVQKIQKGLEKKKYNIQHIKVGSVEEFQGQERTVIIISTVRSTEKFLDIDATFKLGFLRNPKRFNVAITRAKALLIVVGNPKVLCRDEHWRRFIQYCMDNGSYKGCAFQMPEIDDENLAAQLADLGLANEGALRGGDNGLLTRTHFEDQPWKPGED